MKMPASMMKVVLAPALTAALLGISSGAACAQVRERQIFWGDRLEIAIDRPGQKAQARYHAGTCAVRAGQGGWREIVRVEREMLPGGLMHVIVGDLNFDGFDDVACLANQGYMGVNLIYDVFFWQPEKAAFAARPFMAVNPRLDEERRTLISAQKDGPRYQMEEYAFDRAGRPWLRHSWAEPGVVIVHRFHAPDGREVRRVITLPDGDPEKPGPVILAIGTHRAWLHDAPDARTRRKSWLVRGDKVEVLDAAGSYDEWLKIRYLGKSRATGWIDAGTIAGN